MENNNAANNAATNQNSVKSSSKHSSRLLQSHTQQMGKLTAQITLEEVGVNDLDPAGELRGNHA